MDRRKALKKLGILTGGMVLMPSCDFSEEKVNLVLNKFKITTAQEKLMKELVSTMIPEGEITGAGALGINNFVWIMADDCLEDKVQESYLRGMKIFDDEFKKLTGSEFISLAQSERLKVLNSIVGSENQDAGSQQDDLLTFINQTKGFAVLGYMQSSYIMTDIMPYTMVPGTYGACETIDNNKRINVNG